MPGKNCFNRLENTQVRTTCQNVSFAFCQGAAEVWLQTKVKLFVPEVFSVVGHASSGKPRACKSCPCQIHGLLASSLLRFFAGLSLSAGLVETCFFFCLLTFLLSSSTFLRIARFLLFLFLFLLHPFFFFFFLRSCFA